MPASDATTHAPAAAARSSRSVTGRCEWRIADWRLRIGGRLGRIRNPQSQSAIFRCTISPVGTYVSPMPLRLSEHPERDRPRERLWRVGPAALTGQELLAILLGTGCAGRDALAVAGDVQRFYASRLRDLAVEEFHVLALGSQSQVLGDLLITRGILNSSLVHPREVFRAAIAEAAAGIIVVHNHPSGDATPSADDRAVTRQLVDAGRLLDVPVYDHVIVGGDRYVSFAEAGLL